MDAVYTKPGYLFRRMQQIAVAIFVEESKAYDLTPVQYAALVAIQTHPGIDATRLSAVIAFDRSTLGIDARLAVIQDPKGRSLRISLMLDPATVTRNQTRNVIVELLLSFDTPRLVEKVKYGTVIVRIVREHV